MPGPFSAVPAVRGFDGRLHSTKESIRIIRRTQPSAVCILHNSRHSSHVRCDDRKSGGNGFQQAQRQAFAVRWQYEYVQALQKSRNLMAEPAKFNYIVQPKIAD